MFRYCIDVLNLSEAEAYRRIGAARLSRKYPVILTMLEDGRIHLCGIGVLSKHLTDTNYEGVLATAAHKSKTELEELVAELAPKPDVPPTVRKRPQPRAKPNPPSSSSESRPDAGEQETPAARVDVRPAKPEPPASVEPLAPARYKVTFTASAELRDKLRRLQALMPERDLACIIDVAVSAELERLEAKRFSKTNKPRKHVDDADTAPGVRGISAAVKRFVWARDGGQCTFVSDDGKRCPERHALEFDHDEPYGIGGDRSPDNIRLACRTHNLYLAELVYGKEKMDRYRRSPDRVGEPAPAFKFELRLDTAHVHDSPPTRDTC